MPVISPFFWFDDQAEEAANFYVSVFPGSRIMVKIDLAGLEHARRHIDRPPHV